MRQFVLGTQTPGTDLKPPLLTVYRHFGAANVGQPLSFGMTFGVAYVVSKLERLSTEITFRHNFVLLC